MNQSEPKSDLMAWLEQQWDKAVKDSETPDKELLEKYTFYDGLTTAYEFTIARLKNVPNPFLPSCLNYEDIADGEYASLFQLYLDGFELSRTGRK